MGYKLTYCKITQIVVRHGLSHQVLKINERIDELNQNKETYAIESFPSETWSSSSIETDPNWYAHFYYLFVLDFEVISLVSSQFIVVLTPFTFFFCRVPCVQ
jgi:hypothetical protein